MCSPHDRPAPRTRSRRHLGCHLVGDGTPRALGKHRCVRPPRPRLRRLLLVLESRPPRPPPRPHPTRINPPQPRTAPRMRGLRARGRIRRGQAIRRRPRPPRLRSDSRARSPANRPSPGLVRILCHATHPRAHRGRRSGGGMDTLPRDRARERSRVGQRCARRHLRGLGEPGRHLRSRRAIGGHDTRQTIPLDRTTRWPIRLDALHPPSLRPRMLLPAQGCARPRARHGNRGRPRHARRPCPSHENDLPHPPHRRLRIPHRHHPRHRHPRRPRTKNPAPDSNHPRPGHNPHPRRPRSLSSTLRLRRRRRRPRTHPRTRRPIHRRPLRRRHRDAPHRPLGRPLLRFRTLRARRARGCRSVVCAHSSLAPTHSRGYARGAYSASRRGDGLCARPRGTRDSTPHRVTLRNRAGVGDYR